MRAKDLLPESLGPLDRLAGAGMSGMGALVYEPDRSDGHPESEIDLDWLAERSREVLEGEADDVPGELPALNGSSAGARPKALIGYHRETGHIMHGGRELPQGDEIWLVKSANTQDARDAGAVELVCSSMARQAVSISRTHTCFCRRELPVIVQSSVSIGTTADASTCTQRVACCIPISERRHSTIGTCSISRLC